MSALTEVAAPGTDLPRRRARGRGDGLGPWWLVAAVLPVAFLLVFFAWPVAAMLWRGIGGDADAFTGAVDLTAFRETCLLYTSPSPRDQRGSRMPSSA